MIAILDLDGRIVGASLLPGQLASPTLFRMGVVFLNSHHAHQPLCTFPSLILELFIPILALSFFRSYFGIIVEVN